jgi:hypothetical protein
MYIKKCEQCTKDYESERSTSRFCSPACRVTFNRLSVTETVSVTPETVSVTEDFTRKMVEDGDGFIPNWYRLGLNSRNEYKEKAGWNNLMK